MVPVLSGEPELGADGEFFAAAATARRGGVSKSHREAERKRRERINARLDTLRALVPSASRMDKAALLGEVVRYVRELRGMADDAVAAAGGGGSADVVVPGEGDEVVVEDGEDARRVKAWVCCADRPGLMSELDRAVRSASARAVRAEIATVGGRTRSVLDLDVAAGGDNNRAASSTLPALQAELRTVIVSREEMLGVESYKRRRLSSAHFAKV